MGVRETVYARITSASAGSLVGTRCYPDMLPENCQFPAIRYTRISYNDAPYREYGNPTERATIRVQIDCYADDSDAASTLGDAVCTDFDAWTFGTAVGRCRIAGHFSDGWQDDIDAYREIVDIMIDHKR